MFCRDQRTCTQPALFMCACQLVTRTPFTGRKNQQRTHTHTAIALRVKLPGYDTFLCVAFVCTGTKNRLGLLGSERFELPSSSNGPLYIVLHCTTGLSLFDTLEIQYIIHWSIDKSCFTVRFSHPPSYGVMTRIYCWSFSPTSGHSHTLL